jgi:hypothetical protein
MEKQSERHRGRMTELIVKVGIAKFQQIKAIKTSLVGKKGKAIGRVLSLKIFCLFFLV